MFRRTPLTAASTRRPAARTRRSFVPTCVGQSALEARQVLTTASLSPAGVLTVVGTNAADTITVLQVGSKLAAGGSVFPSTSVRSIVVDALGGNDSISVITAIPTKIDGGLGNNTYPNGTDTDTIIDPTLTGGVALSRVVMNKYQSLGGATSLLGQPTGDEVAAFGGRVAHFQGGEIDDSAVTGAHEVHGLIGAELNATFSETDAVGVSVRTILGLATSDETDGLGGRVSHFQGGDIDWSNATGAHAVYGAIGAEYAATANETDAVGVNVQKILGLPTGAETNVPGVTGARMQKFQGGTIYWSLKRGAHAVYGAIGAAYASLGGPAGTLGLPVSEETGTASNRMMSFEHGVMIWTPSTGAHIATM